MKTSHVNALIDSYRVISESALHLVPTRGETYAKQKLGTDKPYILFITFEGDMEGFLAIGISEEVILKVVEIMTNGSNVPTSIDALTISCVTEFTSMIKGNLIKRFESLNIKSKIPRADFISKEELPIVDDIVLTVLARTDIGEFELNLSTKTT